jgi:HEPN domain-containing protein
MVDEELVKEWFYHSDQDLSTAEFLANNMHPVPDEIVCFHCQQSAEKDLKAFLVKNDIEPPKTHDLRALIKMCESICSEFSILLSKCSFLNQYGVMPRYPGDLQITSDDVKIALRYAKDIKEFSKAHCEAV